MVPPLCATYTARCREDGTTADEVCGLRGECEASFPHCSQCSAPWRLSDEAPAPPELLSQNLHLNEFFHTAGVHVNV